MNAGKIIGGGVDLSHLAARAQSKANGTGFAIGSQQATVQNNQNIAAEPQAGGSAAENVAAAHGVAGAVNTQTIDISAAVFEVTDASLDNAVQLSSVVPVLLLLTSAQTEQQSPQQEVLAKLTRKMQGKLVLGVIDADTNPQIVAALQARALPTVVMILAGRPEMLYQGAQTEETLTQLLPQIAALAAQQGMTGTVSAPDLSADGVLPEAPAEPQLNPAHQAAHDAAERGDFKTAIVEYQAVLAKNPRDDEAHAALAQVKLLDRLSGKTMQEIRDAAAAAPADLQAQLAVADLDISGGHVEDGFLRLLDMFQQADNENRKVIQERLLELFEVVGATDPRVSVARRQLANLLY